MKKGLAGLLLGGLLLTAPLVHADSVTVTFQDMHSLWPGQTADITDDSVSGEALAGSPYSAQIVDMQITYNKSTRALEKVVVHETNSSFFVGYDSLFINTSWDGKQINTDGSGSNWQKWDYLVHSDVYDPDGHFIPVAKYHFSDANGGVNVSSLTNGVYKVKDENNFRYTYTGDSGWTTGPDGREGHANGIHPWDLEKLTGVFDTNGSRTFDFNLGEDSEFFDLTWDFTSSSLDGKIILDEKFVIGFTPWCANDVMIAAVPVPSTLFLLGFGLTGLALTARIRKNN